MFTHESEKVRRYNIECRVDVERLIKITRTHVRCKTGNRGLFRQRRKIVTLIRNIYQMTSISMTLSDPEGHFSRLKALNIILRKSVSQKKQGTTIFYITSPNVDRFSNFFY